MLRHVCLCNSRHIWLCQLENLNIEYAPVLPKDTPVSSLSAQTLRDAVLRAVRDYDTWMSDRPMTIRREVCVYPVLFSALEDFHWSWTGCKLTPAGDYILFLCALHLKGSNTLIGRSMQYLHVPSGALVWQYPAKEILEDTRADGGTKPWIQTMETYMKAPRDRDTDVLHIVAVGSASKNEIETGFVRT